MKTIIAGARDFDDPDVFLRGMRAVPWSITEVVSGCAKGADTMGECWAEANNLPCAKFPADWETMGRAAGPIRNAQMAKYGEALVAFLPPESKGTKNMVEQAKKQNLPVFIIHIKKYLTEIQGHPYYNWQLESIEYIGPTKEIGDLHCVQL